MADYRTIRVNFWNDPYIESLDAQAKLLYLYLFSCPYTNNLGIVEVTRRKIAYETAISEQDVNACIAEFEAAGKVICDPARNLIFLTRFIKHQTCTSPKIIQNLKQLISSISSEVIAEAVYRHYPYLFEGEGYPMDTVSIPYRYPMDTVSESENAPQIPLREIGNRKGEGEEGRSPTLSKYNNISARAREGGGERCGGAAGFASVGELMPDALAGLSSAAGEEAARPEPEPPPCPTQAARPDAGSLSAPAPSERPGEAPPEPPPCPAMLDDPPLEFLELREAWDRCARREEPLAGFAEYRQLKARREWPGLDRVLDAMQLLSGQDQQWLRGYAPGLAKFLRLRGWKKEPDLRVRDGPDAGPQTYAQHERENQRMIARMALAGMGADYGNETSDYNAIDAICDCTPA